LLSVLLATAVGTILGAVAVRVSLAFLNASILVNAAIGITSFFMSAGGMLVGHIVGERFGRAAELMAGIVLCAWAAMIHFQHHSALG